MRNMIIRKKIWFVQDSDGYIWIPSDNKSRDIMPVLNHPVLIPINASRARSFSKP